MQSIHCNCSTLQEKVYYVSYRFTIFSNLALLSTIGGDTNNINIIPFLGHLTTRKILRLIPAFGLFSVIIYKLLLKTPLRIVFASVKQKLLLVKQSLLVCCVGYKDKSKEQGDVENNLDEAQLPDRVVNPKLYDAQEDQPTY